MSMQVTSATESNETVQAVNGQNVSQGSEVEEISASGKSQDETKEDSEASENLETSEDTDSQDEKEDSEESKDEKKAAKEELTKNAKKRIDKLVKRNSEKERALLEREREIEYLRKELMKKSSEQPDQPKSAAKVNTSEDRPRMDQFELHEDYLEALTDWKVEQREKAKEAKEKEAQVKTEYQKQVESFQKKVTDFSKEHSDFDDVVSDVDDIPLSMTLQEAILSSEMGPNVMYELAKNREELERINALSPIAAAREIGKIEARIAKEAESLKTENKIKKQTKAPPPIAPVGGGKAVIAKSIDDPTISFADYVRIRREQQKRKG